MRPADVAAANRMRDSAGDRALTQAIQLLHQAMADEPEPGHKSVIATCLSNLTKLQASEHQEHETLKASVSKAAGSGRYAA